MRRTLSVAVMLVVVWLGTQTGVDADSTVPGCAGSKAGSELVNINTASADELVKLPNIGPSRARAILETRAERLFRRVEDILRVHGIGRKTFRQLRDCIRVK